MQTCSQVKHVLNMHRDSFIWLQPKNNTQLLYTTYTNYISYTSYTSRSNKISNLDNTEPVLIEPLHQPQTSGIQCVFG